MDSRVSRPPRGSRGVRLGIALAATFALLAFVAPGAVLASSHTKAHSKRSHVKKHAFKIPKRGNLDCNGFSRRQRSLKRTFACTDIRGKRGVTNDQIWNSRFHDNGHYIGHDEPDMTFLSNAPGSGNNVSWTETLPRDPVALPTVAHPGSDVTHWFELSIAPWFSMAMCDNNSYPQLPCEPRSDRNAPGSSARYPGAGGAFMEMQFYPPGFAPFSDAISCDNSHWCAALTIDSLECTLNFASCNPACEEPVNFAWIQTDGVPTGPPSPQMATLASQTPNAKTVLMNPGDQVTVHMFDAAVPGAPGQRAFEVVLKDLTTGQSGYMQASAKNGFQNTSIVDCSGTPYNFEPEYNTAAKQNITPWAALQTNISTQYEIGHFEPCTKVEGKGVNGLGDTYWSKCSGPYESTADTDSNPESTDAPCYTFGDTHGPLNAPPDEVTGCPVFNAGGDLDFDGTPYWADWPTGTTPTATFPSSFVQNLPQSDGRSYGSYFVQTDAALSESTCTSSGAGCAVPPPNAPGKFYPYFSRVNSTGACRIEFGNVASGAGVNNLGQDAQYGTDQAPTLGYPEFEGPVKPNTCS